MHRFVSRNFDNSQRERGKFGQHAECARERFLIKFIELLLATVEARDRKKSSDIIQLTYQVETRLTPTRQIQPLQSWTATDDRTQNAVAVIPTLQPEPDRQVPQGMHMP